MKLALLGLSNSGKTTVFNALTGQDIETPVYPSISGDPHVGIVKVPDSRVEALSEIFKPKKTTHATVEYVDYLGFMKGDSAQNRKVTDHIKDADALVFVLRNFENDSVVHPEGSIDPVRDFRTLETELIFSDLDLVEKRLERMEDGRKRGKKPDESERSVLLKCRETLEKEIPLRYIQFDNEEQKSLRHLQLISLLPVIILINVSESALVNVPTGTLKEIDKILSDYPGKSKTTCIELSGKIEMEIAQLSAEEAAGFLLDLGIKEAAKDRIIMESYKLLNLLSFLTVGEDEVRAWTIYGGTTAQRAAGKIHSDIEKGFIRAEVISFDEFMASGSMASAKQVGLLRLEGKNYIVQDGDIINFRFNV
ncbi:MAG: redox-regulated ATPase YchF [Thermoplasmata archaeon M9B2D]|nr:MAG: redox-regulated ATPase YchF [Thermoplasmata archaeon M9B2D]